MDWRVQELEGRVHVTVKATRDPDGGWTGATEKFFGIMRVLGVVPWVARLMKAPSKGAPSEHTMDQTQAHGPNSPQLDVLGSGGSYSARSSKFLTYTTSLPLVRILYDAYIILL